MTDAKGPVGLALDFFVYAPLGFALDARELVPKLVDRGHDRLNNQVKLARLIGRHAVRRGQSVASKRLAGVQDHAAGVLTGLGIAADQRLPEPTAQSRARPRTAPVTTSATGGSKSAAKAGPSGADGPARKSAARNASARKASARNASARKAPAPTAAPTPAPVETLAVPGYDSLAASQVIPRLTSLTASELEAVQTYEASQRGRKTILNKIAQLQA